MLESELAECIRLAEDKADMAYVHKWLGQKLKNGQHESSWKGNTRTWSKDEKVVCCLFS